MADLSVQQTLNLWASNLQGIERPLALLDRVPISRLNGSLERGLSTAIPTICAECGRSLDSGEIRMADYYGSVCVDCHRTHSFEHIVFAKGSHSKWPWEKRAWRKRTFPRIPGQSGRAVCNGTLQSE